MRDRLAVPFLAVAVALLAIGPALAASSDVVNSGIPFVATGTVVAKTADSLVVRTDDHRHKVAFTVDRSTVLPGDLAVGRHVRVVYHPMGSTGQAADTVAVSPPMTASR